MSPFNHFDILAPYYDRFIKPIDVDKMCSMAKLPVQGLLLDAGGGTGQKTYPLLKMVDGVVIADSSKGMLTQARKKPSLVTICSESEQLPFDNEIFVRVIMVDALHHVRDYRITASEIWRVTRPGGRIVIEEPDIQTMGVKLMAVIEKALLMRSHFVTPRSIAQSFNYPNTTIQIIREDSTAWIIIDKLAS